MINRINIVVFTVAAFMVLINQYQPDPRFVAFIAFGSFVKASIAEEIK